MKNLKEKLEKAEKLLRSIEVTGSHYQIREKIEEYFKTAVILGIKKENKG